MAAHGEVLMAELVPQPFSVLLARMVAEIDIQGTIFDLPRSAFWKGAEDLDLSVSFHGDRASTAVGPAAGPQSQLAQNIVLSWLAGSRILELKTVQINDRLEIPRPCIDAQNIGFNVEWSQELLLDDSLKEYVSGWYLVHILKELNFAESPAAQHDTLFDFSVGYDLKGIQSDPVARWLDTLQDAGAMIKDLRESLPSHLQQVADVEVPTRLSSCVTLSTFHGCPADEIEKIVEHLFERHQVHVIVKLNPTLLGFEAVEELLRSQLGYDELTLQRKAFDDDLQWVHALEMFQRLSGSAQKKGLTLGAKFTNTLVVENHKSFFPDEKTMYLSGQPLHVISTVLCNEFVQATQGTYGRPSFSAGVDAKNFFESVACGMIPVTTCTDLLRPNGYRRLPRYLQTLEREMKKVGATSIGQYILARSGEDITAGDEPDENTVWKYAQENLQSYAQQLPEDPRYHQQKNQKNPHKVGSHLSLFDCVSCNKCVAVCPNDANFMIETAPASLKTWDLCIEKGEVQRREANFEVWNEKQWATYADFCNECGNCDVFCPEDGGPYKIKPRFFGSRETFDEISPQDAVLVEKQTVTARIDGLVHTLEILSDSVKFSDGIIDVELSHDHQVVSAKVVRKQEGHVMELWRYHAMRLLREAALAGINPVSAPMLVEDN